MQSIQFKFCRAAVLATGVGAACAVSAQTVAPMPDEPDSDIVELPTLDVTGFRESGYFAARSSAGLRTGAPLVETPQSISVITAELIRDQNAQNMQEVLRYTAGVRAEMYGLDNRGDWFTLRGGSEGSTLLDGLRLPLTGWYGVLRNEPFAFERVEVVRGPASILAGQNGPGGVVNLVSKLPRERAGGEINFQLGERNHWQVSSDITGAFDGDRTLLYRVVGLTRASDTQVDFADEERDYFAPSFTWKPSATTTLTVYGQYQRDRSRNTEGFFPWAGTLHPAPNGFIPMDTFVGEPDWDEYGGRRVRLGYQIEQRLNETWTLRHHLRDDRVDGKLRSMYANFWEVDAEGNGYGSNERGDFRTIGRTWYATDDEGRITNGDLLAEARFALGDTRHTLLIGTDGMHARSEQLYADGAAPEPFDVYAPVYGTFTPEFEFGAPTITRTRQTGVFLQDQFKWNDRWVFTGAVRHDDVRTTTDGSVSTDDQAWSKNLGVVYLADGGWAPYLGYAESFEAVAGLDANDIPFRPKRGKQYEGGIKWAAPDQRIVATAAAYHLREAGRLTSDPSDPNFSVQRGEVTVRGVELETTTRLRSWNLIASYTYAKAEVSESSMPDDPELGHQLASIPEHTAALWATRSFVLGEGRAFTIGAGVRYVGATWDGTATIRTPSNTLFDALLAYSHDRWNVAINASNLFDERYIATALTRGDSWFGPRRKVVGTLSYRW